MKKENIGEVIHLTLMVILIISLIANVFLYCYWFDNEYPHGVKQISTDYIKFHEGYYGIPEYITIGGYCYEIQDFDVESKLNSELNSWWDVNYTYEKSKDYFNNDLKFYNMTDDKLYGFEVTYFTYDALTEGNEVHYVKQKVIDGLQIRSSQYPKHGGL